MCVIFSTFFIFMFVDKLLPVCGFVFSAVHLTHAKKSSNQGCALTKIIGSPEL